MEIASTKPRGNPAWQKGVSGNPRGRPVASRQKLAEGMITDLAELWAEGGAAVLRNLMVNEPANFAQLAFGTLPREALISVSQSAPGFGRAGNGQPERRTTSTMKRWRGPTSSGSPLGAITHRLQSP